MTKYRILSEPIKAKPDSLPQIDSKQPASEVWTDTAEAFTGTSEEIQKYLEELREQTGICHAAELIG